MSGSGLEEQLTLDITAALSAVDKLEQAFVQAGNALQTAFEQAVAALQVPDTNVELQATADTSEVTQSLDDALAAVDTSLDVTADGQQLTLDVDAGLAAADTELNVTADTSQAQDAITALSGEQIDVEVNAPGAEDLAGALAGADQAAQHAGESAGHAGEQFAAMGIGAKLAAGEVGAGAEAFHLFGSAGAGAAAGVASLAIVGKELFSNALNARSAQERYNLVLGEFGEAVEHVDVGGLNEDLDTLTVRLGSTAASTQQAAANIFTLGTSAGVSAPKVAKTTEQVIALAARAVAMKPALGDVGDVTQRLFTGLARGGRFASNFGLSLTAAEITARALSDTGKTLASDLTVYEKSAAGAELATEKLGDSLATSLNAGAENVQTKFKAVKATFEDTLERLGQPLLDPVIEGIQSAEPTLESLAGLFADILPPLVDVAGAFADSLAPALDAVKPVAEALGGALKFVADILDAVPGPIKTAALALVGFQLIAGKLGVTLAAANLEAGITGIGRSFVGLAKSINPVTIALAAAVGAFALVQHQVDNTDDAVSSYLDQWVNLLNTAPDAKSYAAIVAQVTDEANKFGDKANDLNDVGSKLFKSGDRRAAIEAATGLRSIFGVTQDVTATQKRLQTQYGLTADAANHLARGTAEDLAAFENMGNATAEQTAFLAEATRATDDFWLAARTGALTGADIAEQAQITGASFEDLSKSVDDARKPVVDFANDVVNSLPGAAKALSDLNEGEGLNTFVANFKKNVEDAGNFVNNIKQLVDEGATDLAKLLLQLNSTDPGKAAALAAQAAGEPISKALKQNAEVGGTQFKETLVDFATRGLVDELSGGAELAANKTREAIGAAMLKIPGQLGGETTIAGDNIAQQLVDAVGVDAPPLAQLPADLNVLGIQSREGFEGGLTGDDLIGVKIAAENMANTVITAAKRVLGIKSPSSVMEDIGELTVAGFNAGLADFKGAAEAIDPLLKALDEFKLTAADVSKASGNSIDEITKSLTDLGKAQNEITPDELLDVGKAVKALGGSKGVKDLQNALAQQVSAAFGGLGGKEISDVVAKLNTQAALTRVQPIIGVTPTVPVPGETNVVKGADAGAPNVDLTVTVTPPPDTTAEEQAFLVARAVGWQLQSVPLS